MVSLKKYEKSYFLQKLQSLAQKTALLLDEEEISLCIERAIGVLDENVYTPRAVLFDNKALTTKNGYTFVDVTPFKIDAICTIYYAKSGQDDILNQATLGVGLFPWLSSTFGISFLTDVEGYLILQGNLNSLNRKLGVIDDYELWPVDDNGKQFLQIRANPDLFICHYLPWLESTADSWMLFEPEYQFVLEYARCQMYLRNQEAVASAEPLGFGKEAQTMLNYWDNKAKETLKEFIDRKFIAYMG